VGQENANDTPEKWLQNGLTTKFLCEDHECYFIA
jgi:hypothetical protein